MMVTAEEIGRLLRYEPETGEFYWLVSKGRTAKAGSRAGWIDAFGYRQVTVGGRRLRCHRLAWLLTYGAMPEEEIDHINGDKADNRLCNLRQATHSQNVQNGPKRLNNVAGLKGVHKRYRRFAAQITCQGKKVHLGSFATAEEAHAAYCAAARKVHGEFARVA